MKKYIKKIIQKIKVRNCINNYNKLIPGSEKWLIATEYIYGGFVSNVKRNKTSPFDHRSLHEISTGGMTGGDRMLHHGYATYYARFILNRKKHVQSIAEIGILKGSGLAMWSDLFPQSRVIGLDIDLNHTKNNIDNLIKLGAFKTKLPELYEFDQLVENRKYLNGFFQDGSLDICIDDGLHSNKAILCTLNSILPYLASEFIYFVEDNFEVHLEIKKTYPGFNVENFGALTVITPDLYSLK
jgi:hypothetical protein